MNTDSVIMPDHPDFLCVGAQKAATSWLYGSLKRLPGLFLPVVKESHFFRETSVTPFAWAGGLRRGQSEKLLGVYRQRSDLTGEHRHIEAQLRHYSAERVDERWYRGVFSFAEQGDLRGEVCPSYFGLPAFDIERVNAINPDVRIVLLVRDPVDRIWSGIRMHKKQRGGVVDLDRLIADPDALRIFIDYTRYSEAIPCWRTGVGDRLRVVLFDDIAERPRETLGEILDHIGYRGRPGLPEARPPMNVGEPTPMPIGYRERLYTLLESQYAFLETIDPVRVAQWRMKHEGALQSAA